ncbi:MAG: hypothetical protein M1838_004282 [Thelocarpon superellum]|nr:MAG: hypothetical protein M1838_004282 [Thelocarpon superellum]
MDAVPADLEISIRFAGSQLTQAAGILLRLPQDIIAQAIVLFTRFWVGPDGGSLRQWNVKDVSAASIYLVAKLSAYPQSPRNIVNVYAYLRSPSSALVRPARDGGAISPRTLATTYYVSEGTYHAQRQILMNTEAHILRVLGFQTHVALPYALAINYLQALDVFRGPSGKVELSRRSFAHLTSALLSPQQLYLTHQPPALATAAIYLAAREVGAKLPAGAWWEVFDVDREELGFLVVAMRSMADFGLAERAKWGTRMVPLTVDDLDAEIQDRRDLDGEE